MRRRGFKTADEVDAVARQFGVAPRQVHRDLLLSHILAAVGAEVGIDDVVFFGGTALARTHLTDGRLSEDVDLMARVPRSQLTTRVEDAVTNALSRRYVGLRWQPPLTRTSGSQPAVVSTQDGLSVQVQLLSAHGYPSLPTEVRDIEQRYAEVPATRLRVYTADAFAASKQVAWMNRRAPRDLYDLWAMSRHGMLTAEALKLFTRHGPKTSAPTADDFRQLPTSREWNSQLGHQTRVAVSPEHAAAEILHAWNAAAALGQESAADLDEER